MSSENKPENFAGDADQEVTKLSESSSSEKSFLAESQVSSLEASGEKNVNEVSNEKGVLPVDESNNLSGGASLESVESSETPSLASDDSKSELSDDFTDESIKTPVEGSQVELVTEVERTEGFERNVDLENNYRTEIVEETENAKIFVNPFTPNMEPGEKMLRTFLLLGLFPLPVIGWIIGLFSSLSIKKKKRIHKILTSILFLLTLLSVVAGMVVLGYFLVKNSNDSDSSSSSSSENKDKAKSDAVPPPKLDVDLPDRTSLVETLSPELRKAFDQINDMIGPDPRIEATLEEQKPGEYKVIPSVVRNNVSYGHEKPKLEYIPPKFLKPPVTVSKTQGDATYDYFEYKHPTAKKEMIILLNGLHESWKSHEMFRFSEYVDHKIKVFNITSTRRVMNTPKLLTQLEPMMNYKTDLGLIADFVESDLSDYETNHGSMGVKKLLAVTPAVKCDSAALSGESNVEFIGLIEKQITCSGKVDFPLMIFKNGLTTFVKKGSRLTDLKPLISKIKVDCHHSIATEKYTKIYLDRLYPAFRKLISASSEHESDPVLLEALCSKAK